jgi:hypothetical protein
MDVSRIVAIASALRDADQLSVRDVRRRGGARFELGAGFAIVHS